MRTPYIEGCLTNPPLPAAPSYVVEYRGQSTDLPAEIPFARIGDASQWARAFVRESYRNEASAVVRLANAPHVAPIVTYRNVHGEAVRS
jgi:hypothetical protein